MEKLNLNNVRVRFAPSPTGMVHIGSFRTILYNYLFAKHHKGKLIMRIEDTDQSRLVPGAVENLLGTLQWAGIDTDEGPYLTTDGKIKERGEFAPYTQSNRLDIYKQQLQVLLDKGKAYPCFCSKERLDNLRAEQTQNKQMPRYDNHCRNLSKKDSQALMDRGQPYVIRFKMPENSQVVFKDLIRGDIVVNTKDLDDYVLIKSDGFPTYHFACVVDDHLMKITQVLRGEEWIASAPKHVLLYEAFDWQPPQFAHLPTILSTHKKKLSKRDGDSSVQDFIDKGYLKDALINFVALLGWNAGTEQEVYTLEEMIKQFSLDNVHKAGAVFDLDKLNWINGLYIRKLSLDEFYNACLPFLTKENLITVKQKQLLINETGETLKPAELKKILSLEQARIKQLGEITAAVQPFLTKTLNYSAEKLIWKKSNKTETLDALKKLETKLKIIKDKDFTAEHLEKSLQEHIKTNSLETGTALWPLRFSLSGQEKSAGPFELAAALGRTKTLERLAQAIMKLL